MAERPRDAHRDERRRPPQPVPPGNGLRRRQRRGAEGRHRPGRHGSGPDRDRPRHRPGDGHRTQSGALSAAAQPDVTAAAAAKIDFSRTAVTTKGDPDGKLKQLLSAQSVGTITRAASAGSLGAPLDQMVTASPFGYRVSPITGGAGRVPPRPGLSRPSAARQSMQPPAAP